MKTNQKEKIQEKLLSNGGGAYEDKPVS